MSDTERRLHLEERWRQMPKPAASRYTLPERVACLERRLLLKALDKSTGNLKAAARYLGITYRAARYLAKKRLNGG